MAIASGCLQLYRQNRQGRPPQGKHQGRRCRTRMDPATFRHWGTDRRWRHLHERRLEGGRDLGRQRLRGAPLPLVDFLITGRRNRSGRASPSQANSIDSSIRPAQAGLAPTDEVSLRAGHRGAYCSVKSAFLQRCWQVNKAIWRHPTGLTLHRTAALRQPLNIRGPARHSSRDQNAPPPRLDALDEPHAFASDFFQQRHHFKRHQTWAAGKGGGRLAG